jgi:hypothetical protein
MGDKDKYIMATWHSLLQQACEVTGDSVESLQSTLTEPQLHQEFPTEPGSKGLEKSVPFTAWGENYVYFPTEYDGGISVGWAPRNPCGEITMHQSAEWRGEQSGHGALQYYFHRAMVLKSRPYYQH